MRDVLGSLTELTLLLHRKMELDQMLQLIADRTAELIQTPLVSVRLLDPARGRLVATCRTGSSLHRDRTRAYRLGEGLVGWIAEHGEPIRLADAEEDPRFLRRPDQERSVGSFLGVPIVSSGRCTGVLSATHPAFDYFTEDHEKQLTVLAALIAPRVEQGRQARVAQLDEVTGVLNRHGLDVQFPSVLDEDRIDPTLSLVMARVDALETLDAEHAQGLADEALRRVAHALSDAARDADIVGRWTDRDLLAVLPGATLADAERLIERVRAAIAAAPLDAEGTPIPLTASFGAAQRDPGERRDDLVARAHANVGTVPRT